MPSCKDGVKDEYHFLMTCPAYNAVKQKLMNMITCKASTSLPKTNTCIFNPLMTCPDYICNALKRENVLYNSRPNRLTCTCILHYVSTPFTFTLLYYCM